jgi:putative DNA primase/helicase
LWPTIIEATDLRQRKIYIAFDADGQLNADVRTASIRLLTLLYAAGAIAYQLTSWNIDDGKGIDDYLVAAAIGSTIGGAEFPPQHPRETMRLLLESADVFIDTLNKTAVDAEAAGDALAKVAMTPLSRSQFCKILASKLGLKTESLRAIGLKEKDDGPVEVEPWDEPVEGEELVDALAAVLERHIVFSEHTLTITVLWIVLSYLSGPDIHVLDTLPLLLVLSADKRFGKTSLLQILTSLVYRGEAATNVTAAVLYRVIEKHHPTWVIDELDSFDEQTRTALMGVLRSGHTPGGYIWRCDENNNPEKFRTWGAKVLALRGILKDEAVVDRSLIVRMIRSKPQENILPLSSTLPETYRELQRKILRWVIDNLTAIAQAQTELRDQLPAISNRRMVGNWLPVLAIARCVGDKWFQRAWEAATAAFISTDSEEESVPTRILQNLYTIWKDKPPANDFVSTSQILSELNKDITAPWMEWSTGTGTVGMTPRKLALFLRNFGIKPERRKINGLNVHGYCPSAFKEAFERCL